MDKKTLFNKALADLVSFAIKNHNSVTMDQVKTYFEGLIEDDSQYSFICDYLAINKITVEGFVPSLTNIFSDDQPEKESSSDDTTSGNPISEKSDIKIDESSDLPEVSADEMALIDMYLKDIEDIAVVSLQEQCELVDKLLGGDTSVTSKIVDSKLMNAFNIAKKYSNKGISFGDLIQEANLELMIAISEYQAKDGDFNNYIDGRIEKAVLRTINDETNSERVGKHLADKLNQLDNATKELNKKLGRVPEISELAKYMGIEEDKVSILLKTSLDTLSVNEDSQITDAKTAEEMLQDNSVDANSLMGQTGISNDDSFDLTKPSGGSDPLTWRKHSR